MELKFDEENWLSTYRNCNWMIPAGEFLKFFSLLYDEKAIRSGIIKKDMVPPLTFLVTLIYHNQQLYDWLGLMIGWGYRLNSTKRGLSKSSAFFTKGDLLPRASIANDWLIISYRVGSFLGTTMPIL